MELEKYSISIKQQQQQQSIMSAINEYSIDMSVEEQMKIINNSKVNELKSICKIRKLKRYSKLRKQQLINLLTDDINNLEEQEEKPNQVFKGFKIVFSDFSDKKLEKYIVERGGEIVKDVTKDVFLVITLDEWDFTGKNKEALDLGVSLWWKPRFEIEMM